MKKIVSILIMSFFALTLFAGVSEAAYDGDSDQTISIDTGLNLDSPLETGDTTYDLQEGTHDVLTETTGVEIDHYYYWIEVDGNSIIGIDPIKGMM